MISDNQFLFRGQVFSFLNCSYEQKYSGGFEIELRGVYNRDACEDDSTIMREIPLERLPEKIIENKKRNAIEDLELL
jgi:hypothetical protein